MYATDVNMRRIWKPMILFFFSFFSVIFFRAAIVSMLFVPLCVCCFGDQWRLVTIVHPYIHYILFPLHLRACKEMSDLFVHFPIWDFSRDASDFRPTRDDPQHTFFTSLQENCPLILSTGCNFLGCYLVLCFSLCHIKGKRTNESKIDMRHIK